MRAARGRRNCRCLFAYSEKWGPRAERPSQDQVGVGSADPRLDSCYLRSWDSCSFRPTAPSLKTAAARRPSAIVALARPVLATAALVAAAWAAPRALAAPALAAAGSATRASAILGSGGAASAIRVSATR